MISDLTLGIPLSSANPLLTILDGEEERRRKRAEWQAKAIDNLDQAVLDWDGFTRDKPQPPLNFAADPETAKKLGIVHSYLAIQSPTATAPEDPVTRGVFRDKIAQERFSGRGVGDDLAFYGEIEKEVTGRKDAKQLTAGLVETAATGALLRATSEAGIDSKSFALWREDAKGKPGYDPGLDYEYREAWNKTQADLKENLEPYLGPIQQVWQSMQSGGADWYDAYDKVPEANRDAFMASLAILVRAQPAEQQPGLWEKIVKTNSRVWQTAGVDTMDFTTDQLDNYAANNIGSPGETPEQTVARRAGDAETRKRRNFIDDINAIRSESYDPVKALGFGEKVAIGIVSTVPYLASAAVPNVGTGLVYAQTERMLARDFRRDLMTGKDGIAMSDAEATALADTLAPYVAAPYAAIERLQVMGLMGKLPALEKVFAATVNKVGNKALRFTGRTVGAAAAETLQENIQQSLPAITQEMAAALSKDIPGTIWKNGKDGFFDGYWENTAVTFATMLPLSIVAGAGGIQADQRARIFADTPDLHLRVLGFSSDSVARIRAAQQQGTFEAQLAIEAEIPNMDPRSEETKDATQELAEALQTEKDAIRAMMDNGLIPRAELGADGTWTLYDAGTGQEIGTAKDWEGAGRLSVAHANFKEEEDADRIAMVFSAYQAAEVSRDWNQRTGRSNEFNLDLGTTLSANQAAAESEEAFNRVASQERAEGGDGSVARAVFGQSRTRRAKGELHTINRILQGGSVLDIFHEETHGLRREAHARGTLTRDGDIAILRAVDAVLAGKSTKEVRNDAGELVAPATRLSFLPADFDTMSREDQDTAIDEGISKIMEAEVIRTRKGGGQRQLPAGFVTKNLSAIARIAGEGTTRKFRAFIRAIRAYFGLQIDRAHQIQKGLDDGTLDRATYQDYMAKLLGVDEQLDLEQAARDTEARIIAGTEQAADLDGDPFSIATSPAPAFSIAPSRLRVKPPKGVTAIRTESLPVWDIQKDDATSLPKVLNTPAARAKFFARLDEALEYLRADPARITTGPGWVKFLRMAGIYGKVPMPPSGLAEIITNPAAYVAKLNGDYHGERTIDSTQESARQGLDGTREMREIIGEGQAPAPWAVALHHLWGILSRMLPPLQQEGMWLRLIAHRPVLDAIQSSIDGTFDLGLAEWEQLVSAAREESAQDAGQVGNSATANANSFYGMLRNLNGRWQDAADVYAAPTSREMGRRFWALDAGALGIKNKVQRFIGLTFGVPGVIMDRWKFVEFWLPTAMEGTGAATTAEFFKYGQNTPSDPTGIYGVYGQVDSDNPVLSLAMYEAFEVVLQEAINKSPELQAHLGDHTNPGGMHWHGWNAIKNEAVGHSSLDLTKDLQRTFGVAITAEDVHTTLRNGSYFTEGAETQQSNLKVTLERGKIRLERTGMAGGLQPGSSGILGQGTGRNAGRSGQQAAEVSFSLGRPLSQTAANIIALAKELDPVAFQSAMQDTKDYIQRRRDEGIPLGPVLEGDQVTLAAQGILTKHLDDPRAVAMLEGYGEDQFSAFSLGPAALADLLGKDAISRIKDPVRRAQAMSRVAREMEAARLQFERLELVAGSKRLKKSLAREAAIRTALRREELENEAWARHWQILSDDDLVKIKQQPAHKLLGDPHNPMRGRIQSRTATIAKNPELYSFKDPGEYNGSEGVSRSVFGGTLTADLAVEELVSHGLLPEGSKPDAMWALLESEARSVSDRKRDLSIAKQELREARTQATDETNVWLREQGVIQETTFSDKQEILRALGVLDGILSSVPAEIRGKIGGYTQLARIATNEAKLAFLKDRLAKVDTELEKYLREQFDREFRALLDKAKPEKDEAGKKPRGKIGADVHELFAAVREAMTMTGAEVEADAVALESLVASGDYTAAQESHMTLQANLIRLAGDWGKADAARREAALIEATSIYAAGYMAHKTQTLQKREKRQKVRDALQQATGMAGTPAEIAAAEETDQGSKLGRALSSLFSLMSFEQVVSRAFGEDTQEARDLVDWERHAAHAKADSLQNKYDQLDDLFATLAGGKLKGEELRFRLGEVRQDRDKKGNPKTPKGIRGLDGRYYSEFQAITATLMWRQEDGRRHMEGHVDDQGAPAGDWNFTQAYVDDLEAKLSNEAKAVRLHLSEQYAAEYDRLNAVFRDLNGVSLPRHKLYSPITVKPVQATGGQVADPVNGVMTGLGLTPGSLKNRSHTAIAQPDFRDALQVYIAHSKAMEHWIAYAPFSTEAMGILNTRDLGNSVQAGAGKEALSVLRSWLDVFAQGGTRDAAAHLGLSTLLGRLTGRAAATALVGRVSVLAIQSTQLGAALAEMPTASYISRLARLFAGRLDWSGAIQSDYIQRRRAQMPPIVQQAMEGLTSSKPSRLKYAVRKMGETIAGADALFTAGTFAIVLDYQLQQAKALGLTGAQAKAFALESAERATDRVAQPVRPGTRSLYEVTAVNPLARISWAFASDARQKLALSAYALANKPAAAKARALAVTWLAGGVVASLIRAAMRDIRDDGDDDEIFDAKNWDPKRLALSALTGPLAGVPALGDLLEAMAFKLFGEYLPEGNLISGGIRSADTLGNVPDWFTGDREGWDTALKDAEALMGGFGLVSDSAAAATSLLHVARDLFGIGQNLTD